MYKTVQTTRLYEQIVDQISKSIVSGQLKPGDQLPAERDLARRFGVSRTAVREAVKALGEKGLVEALPGRGTFITDGTARAIRQFFDLMMQVTQVEGADHLVEFREMLEPQIAMRAAARARQTHLDRMRAGLATMERTQEGADAFIEADLDFHRTLADAAANPLVLAFINSIVDQLREQRLRIFHVDGGPARGQFHHRQILDAIERRDPEGARQAMAAHLLQVREDSQRAPAMAAPAVAGPAIDDTLALREAGRR